MNFSLWDLVASTNNFLDNSLMDLDAPVLSRICIFTLNPHCSSV